jgi:hypothetical protein
VATKKSTSKEYDEIQAMKAKVMQMRDEYLARMKEDGQKIVIAAFEQAKARCPLLGGITWTQYTPYFNDGSPCVFRVGDAYGFPKGCPHREIQAHELDSIATKEDWVTPDFYVEKQYEYNGKKIVYYAPTPYVTQAVRDFSDFMDDEMMLQVFGDYVRVTVTDDGIEVDDYDHE